MDIVYQAALLHIAGIGNARLKNFLHYFGSGCSAWNATMDDLLASHILDTEMCNKFVKGRAKIDISHLATNWEKTGISLYSLDSDNYPELLRTIFDAPQILFVKGELPVHKQLIAIVGARKATAYGKNAATMLAKELCMAGCWIVSGAARGIDTAAHEGALSAGSTIAVLGNGINVSYPPENARLLDRIASQGAVISEYPPDTQPIPGYFPARNRIISGLSLGVVIVEAAQKSGSLITADYALEEGRDVFAVPGSIFSETSRGCNRLIKQGAKLVEAATDILEEFNIQKNTIQTEINLSKEETEIIRLLDYENPLSLEELAIKSTLSAASVIYILLQLELSGLVIQQSGQRFLRSAGGNS